MRTPNTTSTLFLSAALLFSTIAATGCNRLSPTEPENPMYSLPADEAPENSVAPETSTSSSRRTRPARTGRPPETIPSGPASGTDPSLDPTPPPAEVPPAAPPTMTSDCNGPCDGILRVPAGYMDAVYAARDRVRSAVESGEIKANNKVRDWNVTPRVEWKACFFWVENGFYYDANGNRIVGGCAAGMTDYSKKKIVISTKDESRTLALVKWEAMNYYLYLIGRKDLLDRWQ